MSSFRTTVLNFFNVSLQFWHFHESYLRILSLLWDMTFSFTVNRVTPYAYTKTSKGLGLVILFLWFKLNIFCHWFCFILFFYILFSIFYDFIHLHCINHLINHYVPWLIHCEIYGSLCIIISLFPWCHKMVYYSYTF